MGNPNSVFKINLDTSDVSSSTQEGSASIRRMSDNAVTDISKIEAAISAVVVSVKELAASMNSVDASKIDRNPATTIRATENAGLVRESVTARLPGASYTSVTRDDAAEIRIANQKAALEMRSREAERIMNERFEVEIAQKSGRQSGDLGGVRDAGFIESRIAGDALSQKQGVVALTEQELLISSQREAIEARMNSAFAAEISLKRESLRVEQESLAASSSGRSGNTGNYGMINQRLAGTYSEYGSVQEESIAANATMNAQFEKEIAVKEKAAKETENLSKAQERAALSGMNQAEKVSYLKQKLDGLTPGTIQHAQAQTQLNNAINEGSNSISRVTSLITKMAVSMLVWEGFRLVTESISEVIKKEQEYSLETARFAAITNQSVAEAKSAWGSMADIGISAGVKPMDLSGTMRTAQLAQGTDAEKARYVEVIAKLQEVTGEQADSISKSVYSVLQQAGLGLADVGKIGDQVIATLQKMPNIKIQDVFSAMQEAPALAKLWGTSFEDAFNIIVQGAARAQESPEQMATSFQRLSAGINELSQGGSGAYERIAKLRDVFNFDIAPGGKVMPIMDALRAAAEKLPEIPAAQQQEFLEALSGGSIRPEQMRNIIGGIDAFKIALGKSMDGLSGVLDDAAKKMDDSWGQVNARMEAGLEKLKMTGNIGQNLGAKILAGTIGQLGKQGAEFVANDTAKANRQALMGEEGAAKRSKEQFISSLYGLTPDEAKAAIKEFNNSMRIAAEGAILTDPFNTINIAKNYDDSIIKFTEIPAIMANLGSESGRSFLAGMKESLDIVGMLKANLSQIKASEISPAIERSFPSGILGKIGQEESTTAFRRDKEGKMTGLTGESVLDRAGQVDLTKNTEQEVASARQLALDLARQDIQAQREFYAEIGLTKDEIDKIIAARQAEIDATVTLVRTQQGLNYEVGAQGKYLQEAMRQQENLKNAKKEENNFQFKRLKDVDPSQFGQLQALTQMYDKFLTNIGSPEKSQNINLLMGENNVFKTMNGRMTALQMALEDLTKVEKAQLSGTWNMPAGATAMVPISSLDIQRWNKAEGGGMSEEMLRALLGATGESGDKVSESQQLAATRIIDALRENLIKSGLPTDKVDQAKTPSEAIKGAQDTIKERFTQVLDIRDRAMRVMTGRTEEVEPSGGVRSPYAPPKETIQERYFKDKPAGLSPELSSTLKMFAQMLANNQPRVGGRGMFSAGGGSGMSDERDIGKTSDLLGKAASPNIQVSVSQLPVKTTLNANISVMMNGAVVARALMPIMWDMLIRAARSSGVTPRGTVR